MTWTDTNHNSDFRITNDDGKLIVYDTTRGAHVMDFLANGDVRIRNDKGLYFGESNDLLIGHDGSSTRIEDSYGYLGIKSNALELRSYTDSELYAKFTGNGAGELYHDNVKTAFTSLDAWNVYGRTSNSGMIEIASNQGANNNDRFRIHKTSAAQRLSIQNYASGSWVENIRMTAGGSVELKHSDGTTKMHTDTTGITVNSRITASGDSNTYINVGSTADTLEFYTGGSNVFKFDSSGRIVVNNGSAQDGAAKLQIKGGTAANILTADITNQTVAVFGGGSPGTTQTGYGAGIVIKPIISLSLIHI